MLQGDEHDILDTGFVNYAQDDIEENARDVLTTHISSRLEIDTEMDEDTILTDGDETRSAKTYKIHKI